MIKAVIFDMDGLIFDSENLFMQYLSKEMEKYEYKLTREIYVTMLGWNLNLVKDFMKKTYGEDYPFEEISAAARRDMHDRAHSEGLPVKKGIRELLEYLKEHKIKTAVASSTYTNFVTDYIKSAGLYPFFDVIVGGDMAERSKPEPDIFLKACELLSEKAEDCIVIEDSETGVTAALNGNIRAICIPDMKAPSNEVSKKLFALAKDGFEVKEIIDGQI